MAEKRKAVFQNCQAPVERVKLSHTLVDPQLSTAR
jgi:hypothetical protein